MYLARVIVIKKAIKQKTVSFRQFLNNVLCHTFHKVTRFCSNATGSKHNNLVGNPLLQRINLTVWVEPIDLKYRKTNLNHLD